MDPAIIRKLIGICTSAIGKMPNSPDEYSIWIRRKIYLNEIAKDILSKDKMYWVEFMVILMRMPELSTLNNYILNYNIHNFRVILGNLYMSLSTINNKISPLLSINKFKKNLEECIFLNKELRAADILVSIKN